MRWRASRKKSYLEERYEVVMHNYTFMRLLTLQPSTPEEQVDCNAFLESFGVHARNLVESLSNEAGGDEFGTLNVPDFQAPDQAPSRRFSGSRGRSCVCPLLERRIAERRSTSTTRNSFTPGSCPQSSGSMSNSPRSIARA
jgi:hypothetical protein